MKGPVCVVLPWMDRMAGPTAGFNRFAPQSSETLAEHVIMLVLLSFSWNTIQNTILLPTSGSWVQHGSHVCSLYHGGRWHNAKTNRTGSEDCRRHIGPFRFPRFPKNQLIQLG